MMSVHLKMYVGQTHLKMRSLLIFGLVLVASTSAFVEVSKGYHEEIGVPAAEKIKAYEDSILANEVFNGQNRIVGGSQAPANAHPHFAGLLISLVNTAGNSVCGSSLISANRLVTAAHCWNDGRNQAWQFLVILGSNFLFSGGTRIATSQVIMHPQWTPSNLNNDVAIIYLSNSVPFSAGIRPIDIPRASEVWELFVGNWATAVGFGRTSDQQAGASTVVSQVNLQVISVNACRNVFGSPWVQESTLCTNGAGAVGICGGDSGGPLAVHLNGRLVLIGVSSFVASAGCQLGHPSAFARVTSYRSFIAQHM